MTAVKFKEYSLWCVYIASTQYYLKLTAEAFPDVLEQMDELTGHVFPEVGGVVYEE